MSLLRRYTLPAMPLEPVGSSPRKVVSHGTMGTTWGGITTLARMTSRKEGTPSLSPEPLPSVVKNSLYFVCEEGKECDWQKKGVHTVRPVSTAIILKIVIASVALKMQTLEYNHALCITRTHICIYNN